MLLAGEKVLKQNKVDTGVLMTSIRHSTEQTYIVTHDLGERIENLQLLGLKTPEASDPFFLEFHNKVKNALAVILPEVKIVTYDMKRLVTDVWTEAIRIQRSIKDAIVVSSCAEVASARRGHTIEVNRLVDENGKIIGLGPRPGNPPIGKQISGVATVTNGNPVVLAEDGAFTGGTLEYILGRLESRGGKVAAIVTGICFPGAIDNIRRMFSGEIVVVEEIEKPYEWMPDHDFVPFAPNCGRVFGEHFGSETLPCYNHEGVSYCFPYVKPYGDPVDWASIPVEHASPFSLMCLLEALKLFKRIDEMNGRRITAIDLAGSMPRVSVPMVMGSRQLPDAEMPITDFLHEACEELA